MGQRGEKAMKSVKRQITGLFFLFAVCLMMTPAITQAKTIASGKCGYMTVWTLDDAGTLTITAAGKEGGIVDNYYSPSYSHFLDNCPPWYSRRDKITSVVIGDNIVEIGDYAFYRCRNLKRVKLPGQLKKMGEGVFFECEKLVSIALPDNLTEIREYMFIRCSSLESVVFPKNLKSIGYNAFGFCKKLKEAALPDGMQTIGEDAFYYCEGMKRITIPESVTNIGKHALCNCISLKTVSLPKTLTKIDYGVLSGCSGLTEIRIPENVTEIAYNAFDGCSSLSSITIPDKVKTIGDNAFSFCTRLKHIKIPKSVNAIGTEAFYYCDQLKRIYYGGTKSDWDKIKNAVYEDREGEEISPVTVIFNYTSDAPKVCRTHVWDSGKTIKEPTAKKNGYKKLTCTVCLETDIEVLPKLGLQKNPLSVKGRTVKVKYKKLKKKAQVIKISKAAVIQKAEGKVTYKKVKGNRKITVNKKSGKITVKKKLAKGAYPLKIKIKAAGNMEYEKGSKTVTVKIKVK